MVNLDGALTYLTIDDHRVITFPPYHKQLTTRLSGGEIALEWNPASNQQHTRQRWFHNLSQRDFPMIDSHVNSPAILQRVVPRLPTRGDPSTELLPDIHWPERVNNHLSSVMPDILYADSVNPRAPRGCGLCGRRNYLSFGSLQQRKLQ